MSKTCKDCRWWQGVPVGMKRIPEARYCDSPGVFDEAAGACAGDEYGIFTGPDFGCVHWKCCVCDYQCHCENDE